MLSPEVKALIESGIAYASAAAGIPPLYVPALVDLFDVIASAPDKAAAIARAKQNALADAEDATVETAVDQLLKHGA